jgi:hypothetical protein
MGELALAGDITAARLYLEYCVGRPVQALELSGPDGEKLGGDPVADVERILETLSTDQLKSLQELTEAFAERQAMLDAL